MVSTTHHTSHPHPTATATITSVQPLDGVRAGSALVRHGNRLLLTQDDDYTLVWLDTSVDPVSVEHLPLRDEFGAMAKSMKPEIEAAALLADGRVLIMGSGSAEPRRNVVLHRRRAQRRLRSSALGCVNSTLPHS